MLAEAEEAERTLYDNPSCLQPLNCNDPGGPATDDPYI